MTRSASLKSVLRFCVILAVTGVVAFWTPVPSFAAGRREWEIVVIFLGAVLGIIIRPFPMPIVVLSFLGFSSITNVIPEDIALSGFSSSVTWMVVVAFFLARACTKTILGRRIALFLLSRLGHRLLGISYSLAIADLLLAPLMPSNTARGGGVVYPLAQAIAMELQGEGVLEKDRRLMASYLIFTAFQTNVITSAMFLTAMAANPLALALSVSNGGIQLNWIAWAIAAFVPGIVSLVIIPLVILCFHRPTSFPIDRIRNYARKELQTIGHAGNKDLILVLILGLLVTCWATSHLTGISPVMAGLLSICALVQGGVLEVIDITGDVEAWSTFIWLGGAISLANALSKTTVIGRVASIIAGHIPKAHSIGVLVAFAVLYLFMHYLFVGITPQILTVLPIFVAVSISSGARPGLTTLVFCFWSNLYGCLTHYGAGPAPIFYGSGYITPGRWLRMGFVVGLVHIVIWFVVGLGWWRVLGY